MNIRQMKISDYDDVFQLWNQTAGMRLRSLDDAIEGIDKFLKRNPTTNFVAEEKNYIYGVIMSGHDGRRGYIYHTCVHKDKRNQGIGKQLVEKCLQSLEKEGIKKVALVVYANNDIGNDFWQKLGFIKREDLYYRNISLDLENI